MKYNLKWVNRYSRQEGYVRRVMKVKGHFVNTFDQAEAKSYASERQAMADIAVLEAIGEAEQNEFYAVAAV